MVDFERIFGLSEPVLAENQESEHESYGEKMGDACCGMGFGFVLFFGCLALSGWNEYNSVTQQKTIDAAKGEWNPGSCTQIDSALEGKLVHITCPVSNLGVLGDDEPSLLGVPEEKRTGLTLESYMEIYQWEEHASTSSKEDKVGGGTTKTTTYTYSRNWGAYLQRSVSSFFEAGESCKRQNNGYACLNWDPSVVEPWWSSSGAELGYSTIDTADAPMVGQYFIPKSQLDRIGKKTLLTPACSNSTVTASGVLLCSPGGDAILKGNQLHWQQQDSNNQMVDYLSRSYSIKTADTISILALQTSNTFERWASPADDAYAIYEVVDGSLTAEEMLGDLEAENTALTWFLRFATLLGCIVGLVLITAPIATLPDIIPCVGPFIGDLIGYVLWAVNCAFGCCCWTFVTAICWIVYRPTLGIILLCVCVVLCAGGGFLTYQNRKVKQTRLKAEAEMAAKKESDLELNEEEPEVKVPEQP